MPPILESQAPPALMDARRKPIPLNELLTGPAQARAAAIQRGDLWTVLFQNREDKHRPRKTGFALVIHGAADASWDEAFDIQHGPFQKLEMIGTRRDVRRAALNLFPEDLTETTVRFAP